jgi:hypothetical protein
MYSVALRVQQLPRRDQVLALARLAEARAPSGRFGAGLIDSLYDEFGLPRPTNTKDIVAKLGAHGLLARLKGFGTWRLTPSGRQRSVELIGDMDLAALIAEAALAGGPDLGRTRHPLIPPAMAPPELLDPLRRFLEENPFDRNVFGMTRFPDAELAEDSDPIASAIDSARTACEGHGLHLHLASDRAIVDDLWSNVTAHMWASRYGLAFFEDRRGEGLNYNLTIEVGAMLVTGRRCALLKDPSIEEMPTDLVAKIYKPVDFDSTGGVSDVVHRWLKDDLILGGCAGCK